MSLALRIRCRGAFVALAWLAGMTDQPADAAAPLDPPAQYRAHGEGVVTISGPYCCGDARLSGRFDAAYQVDSAGQATLGRLGIALDDADVVVPDGFLGLFERRIAIRCGSVGLDAPATGSLTAPDVITFAAGTVPLRGFSAESREPDGACPAESLELAGTNSEALLVTHRPGLDQVAVNGAFTLDIEGAPHVMQFEAAGRFRNRPPVASLAFRDLDGIYPQEGCPAFWRWNGQQWELAAEANDPNGLVAGLLSYAGDPDGSWSAADVLSEQWFDTRAGGARERLAFGHDVGPFVFGWGAGHTVELLAHDHAGAGDATSCAFRVVDTRPPAVQPPAPVTVSCSWPGGATAATSPALAAFLQAGSATDVVDASPARLPPQRNGVDVTPTTAFPADGVARPVRFRFQDDWGNVGAADSTVRVTDTTPPGGFASATPGTLAPTNLMVTVNVGLWVSDLCGGAVTSRLKKITSNAPQFDASDVQLATYGTDDRTFNLRARLAAPGVDRLYAIAYEVRDPVGNTGLVNAYVWVRAQ